MAAGLFAGFFDDPDSWMVFASGQSEAKLHCDKGPDGQIALRMDYDFHGGRGFVVARKEIQFVLPEIFEFHFFLRGHGLRNNMEFKIIDPLGADVWRHVHEEYQLPHDWHQGRISERDLPFAWGPQGGGPPKVVGAIELVIVAGPGGSGSVWFADLSLEDQTLYLPKSMGASSHLPSHPPGFVFEHGSPSGWCAEPGDKKPRWWVDFGRSVRFGGLVIDWPLPMPPRAFDIEISQDGESWTRIYQAKRALGQRTHIPAPKAEARHVRVNFANSKSASLGTLHLRPDSFSHSPNDFIHAVAGDFPRGWFPRYWHHEQSYWTPVGSPEGVKRALINEEGMVEVDEGGFSLEPFLVVGGKLVTWVDAEIQTELAPDGVPLPVVTWSSYKVKLQIMPWIDGTGDDRILRVKYRFENASGRRIRLAIAARPFQVNPPWQAFRNLGGMSPIHDIVCNAEGMVVEGRKVIPNRPADDHGVAAFEEEGIVPFLARGAMPPRDELRDESGLASAVLSWKFTADIPSEEIVISVPFHDNASLPAKDARDRALAHWREILSPVEWKVPGAAARAVRCFRTAACHIMINRDGPAIQPGPRRYTRSWVRDCVIMGSAMAKAGQPHVLREFISWYCQFQRDDGFVPAVVDRDGIDWIVEHDSHGQFIWGVCEVFRGDPDRAFLKQLWPHVRKAANYMAQLRKRHMPEAFTESMCDACYGLLPESVSHEGYMAHPVHSYWDDFWGIRGIEAAIELAEAMAAREDAIRWREESVNFLGDTLHSIREVIRTREIEYIPGSVEWADFDPTATANAIALLDFAEQLPQQQLHEMLDTYLAGFRGKHRGELPWLNYTAYEIRIIGAFIRLGRREEALELLQFFLADTRPQTWNQWPEITWRDPRSPGHLGDVPHTWIAAEYMMALASMIASEREHTEAMVLASGLPWSWISDESGFEVRGLINRFGSLDFHLRGRDAVEITFDIREGISMPPGGLTLDPPLPPDTIIVAGHDTMGRSLKIIADGHAVVIESLPLGGTLILGPAFSSDPA